MTTIRRILAAVAVTAATSSLALGGLPNAEASVARESVRVKTTAVTVAIKACEGCEVMLLSYTAEDPDSGWSSESHAIVDGKATFVVPTDKTLGLSVAVDTPWEGHLGYTTMAVMRYQGLTTGDRIGFNRARQMKKASGCYAGTTKRELLLRLKVRRVMVEGVFERVPGQIVFAPITQ